MNPQTTRRHRRAGYLGTALVATLLVVALAATGVLQAVETTGPATSSLDTGIKLATNGPTDGPIGSRRGEGPPEEVGLWEPPVNWPVIAIHTALLSSGKVIQYSYPPAGSGESHVTLWDPTTNSFDFVPADMDLFCSGLTFLADGTLFVTGGTNFTQCLFQGRVHTNVFDPLTQSWSQLQSMSVARWYPTNMTLGDGRVLISSGLDESCESTPIMEMFTPGVGMEVIPEGERFLKLFPRMHILTSGKVAHVGEEEVTFTFDPATRAWEEFDTSNTGERIEGTSVLIPGRTDEVMIIGGYVDGVPTATCERIDFNDEETGWQFTGSLNFGRAHANAVLLPDGQVLLVGGGTEDSYGNPVLNSEMYDPETEEWTLLPPQVHGRMYHSTAVLLADGRVLSAGQDDGAGGGESEHIGEIYEPSYLFRGPRPTVTAAPDEIGYGATFVVETPDAAAISSVVLIAPGTVTHSVNNSQRHVGLDFSVVGENELLVVAPPNGNYAPPGYYMLFLLTDDDVPSEAVFVRVDEGDDCEGDANGDGTVDPLDAGFVLARFGCPVGTGDPNCDAADQNGDGAVDPLDSGFVLARFGDCS